MASVANFAKTPPYRKPKRDKGELIQVLLFGKLTKEVVDDRAEDLGMDRSSYIRHLIKKDLREAEKEQAKLDFLRSGGDDEEEDED